MTTPVPTDDVWMDETDRVYISRYSNGPFLIQVRGMDGKPTRADGDGVTLTLESESSNGPEPVTQAATYSPGSGPEYMVVLPSSATASPGPYTARWEFSVGGVEMFRAVPVAIGGAAPAYDALDPGMKAIVEAVWLRMADQFDSPYGGPHLQVYRQAHFGRNRVAQLLPKALGVLNTISQPHMTYSVDGGKFPLDKWGALLELALWIEVIKHMRRSYLEQPNEVGVNVAYLDRKSYSNFWAALLAEEQPTFTRMLDHFKMAHMGLGKASLLVSGGVFPTPSVGGMNWGEFAAPRGTYLMKGY